MPVKETNEIATLPLVARNDPFLHVIARSEATKQSHTLALFGVTVFRLLMKATMFKMRLPRFRWSLAMTDTDRRF
ncbi:hypothetical protein KAX35_07020 [candidate division WOR-3 bacterium]|nr:hypothetical protein [candidate division WOR-3 bacterium]